MARNKKPEGFPVGEKEISEVKVNEGLTVDENEPKGVVIIKPTIGRIVLFYDGFSDQPCAAQISYVHNNECINIGYLDKHGMPQSKCNVPLIQNKTETKMVGSCEWMDYQVGQANK